MPSCLSQMSAADSVCGGAKRDASITGLIHTESTFTVMVFAGIPTIVVTVWNGAFRPSTLR